MVTSAARYRRGFSLVETAIAALLLAVVAVALLQLLATGTDGTARAGEVQLAAMVAARAMDRLVAGGYGDLVDLEGEPQALSMDGLTFAGTFRVVELEPGLLRVCVTVLWQRHGRAGAAATGSFDLVRYVADPCLALAVRGAFGGDGR